MRPERAKNRRLPLQVLRIGSLLLSILAGVAAQAEPNSGERSVGDHQLMLLNSGAADLEQRLRMIAHAESSIDIETFAFVSDSAGQVLMQAIVARQKELAARGRQLKVRVLVDNGAWASGHPDPNPAVAAQLASQGVEVRYYNRVEGVESITRGLDRDSRTHRKIFIVDGKEMLAGGRNLGASDFGLGSDGVNYVDVGVFVKGPVVGKAEHSFNDFWTSQYSVGPTPEDAEPANTTLLDPPPAEFVKNLRQRGEAALAETPVVEARDISFVSASPEPSRNRSSVASYFHERLGAAQKRVLLENYIYIPTKEQDATEKALLAKGVKIDLLTNGVDSSGPWKDHWELSFPYQAEAAQKGIHVMAYRGDRPEVEKGGSEKMPSKDWMIHSKMAVVDDKDTWIGTNNIDPRSENLNAEWAIVVNDNPKFAEEVRKRIHADMKKADDVTPAGQYVVSDEVEGIPCATGEVKTPEGTVPSGFLDWASNFVSLQVRKSLLINEY